MRRVVELCLSQRRSPMVVNPCKSTFCEALPFLKVSAPCSSCYPAEGAPGPARLFLLAMLYLGACHLGACHRRCRASQRPVPTERAAHAHWLRVSSFSERDRARKRERERPRTLYPDTPVLPLSALYPPQTRHTHTGKPTTLEASGAYRRSSLGSWLQKLTLPALPCLYCDSGRRN